MLTKMCFRAVLCRLLIASIIIYFTNNIVFANKNLPINFLKPLNISSLDKIFNNNKITLAAIIVNANEWADVNKIIVERGTLVGFSWSKIIENNNTKYICRGLYSIINSPSVIDNLNQELSKVTKAKLIPVKEGSIYLAWQRFKRLLHTGNIEEVVQLGIEYARIKFTNNNNYRDYKFAVEAFDDPYKFTQKYYEKHCSFFVKEFPLWGQIMDILSIKLSCENPGEPSFEIFEAKLIMRNSGNLFNIPPKYQDPWKLLNNK